MADHPLRPATDHCLGRPLPHQLANPTRAPPIAINLSPRANPKTGPRAHAVLAEVSLGYPPLLGRFPRATHPCATPLGTEAPRSVRLACVKHAASVRSEPGSNSHVQSRPIPPCRPNRAAMTRTNPSTRATKRSNHGTPPPHGNEAPLCASTRQPRRRPRIPSSSNNVNQQPPRLRSP